MKALKYLIFLFFSIFVLLANQGNAQTPNRTGPASADVIQKARVIVDAHMDSLDAHRKFIYAMGVKNPTLLEQYRMWMKEYPQSVTIPLSIGTVFYNARMAEARDFLLEVTARDPDNADTWLKLSVDADRRGEYDLATKFIKRAIHADATNAGYGFVYLRLIQHGELDILKKEVFDFVQRFPTDNLGAAALYLLCERATEIEDKIDCYEELRRLYPLKQYSYSESGMIELTDIYLQRDPEKALELIKEVDKEGDWQIRSEVAESLIEADKLEQSEKYKEAVILLDSVKLPEFNYIRDFMSLKRADLREKAGDVNGAYNSLSVEFATLPSDALSNGLDLYGSKLGKNKEQIREDIDVIRRRTATPAYPFELGLYTSNDTLSLKALRGKVILLTFWFPACAPCKKEFPHFQAVVDSFKSDSLVYIGINGMPLQDGFVLPFLENNKFSFIPLRGNNAFANEKYGVEGYPANFLIDKNGRIVFQKFSIGQNNRRTLELMISSLLEKGLLESN